MLFFHFSHFLHHLSLLIFSFTLSYQPSHLFTLSILFKKKKSFFIVFIPIPVEVGHKEKGNH
jgi:hypothetical protein